MVLLMTLMITVFINYLFLKSINLLSDLAIFVVIKVGSNKGVTPLLMAD